MVGREVLGKPLDGPRKSKFLKKDREAVASVVGTIMALLVFLTFMSLFIGTYVPIWMKDKQKLSRQKFPRKIHNRFKVFLVFMHHNDTIYISAVLFQIQLLLHEMIKFIKVNVGK